MDFILSRKPAKEVRSMDLIKPVDKVGKGFRSSIREKSPREYIIDYILEKEDLEPMFRHPDFFFLLFFDADYADLR